MRRARFCFIVAATLLGTLFFEACSQPSARQQERRDPAETSSPAPAKAEPATVDSRPVIVAFGDSLTAGVSGQSYPEALQLALDKAGLAYRVENQGVSGDTTTDGLARIDNVIAAHPALVLLEFGGNDGLRGVPVESTRSNLEQMIQRLKGANVPLVLLGITLPPNYGPDYVQPFTAIFPDLAATYKLKLMPFLLIHVYRKGALMQPDGIHPNERGNTVVAADVLELIQPLLNKR